MALKPSDLDRRKAPFVPDEGPLPTDDEVARHLGISPEVFRNTPPAVEANEQPVAPTPPEGSRQPGEGSV